MPHPKPTLPDYDFSEALALPVPDRLAVCLKTLLSRGAEEVAWGVAPIPLEGATEAELCEVERGNSEALPPEYRAFLSLCRYLDYGGGWTIWGVTHTDPDGLSDTFAPWISEDHGTDAPCWVIGDYWRYADGDQLLLLPEEPGQPVVLYLHEDGPALEIFAPSFSLALWRWVHEKWV